MNVKNPDTGMCPLPDGWMEVSLLAGWQAATESQMAVEVIPLYRLLFMLMNTGSCVTHAQTHTLANC